MAKVLTARLDERSQKELAKLSRALSKSESEIVRDSIHLMAVTHLAALGGKPNFIGIGEFESGQTDLASNQRHLDDFGR